jgi:hypothetical protein
MKVRILPGQPTSPALGETTLPSRRNAHQLRAFGCRSPGSAFGHFLGENAESLRPHAGLFPFSGDRGGRLGPTLTAWRARQCAPLKCLEIDGRGVNPRGTQPPPRAPSDNERTSPRQCLETCAECDVQPERVDLSNVVTFPKKSA